MVLKTRPVPLNDSYLWSHIVGTGLAIYYQRNGPDYYSGDLDRAILISKRLVAAFSCEAIPNRIGCPEWIPLFPKTLLLRSVPSEESISGSVSTLFSTCFADEERM